MNDYENSRRAFIASLGLAIGTTALGAGKITATVLNDKSEFPLTDEQQIFITRYEKWMDDFIPVIKAHKANENDNRANQQIAELSEEAEAWREQLVDYMKDENFARHYMTVTERMTKEIY